MLLFKKKFLDAIRSGEKTQTIRLWKHRRMRSGQRSYIPGIGPIQITSVETIELDDLTEEDARRDGFDSAQALREEIDAIYAADSERAEYQPYRVRFKLLDEKPREESDANQAV